MKHKTYIIICILFSLSLCGCQLAKKESIIKPKEDQLVGGFITHEHMEPLSFDESGKAKKIYAKKTIDKDNHEIYQFNHMDGYLMLIQNGKAKDGSSYTKSYGGDGFTDYKIHSFVSDEEDKNTLIGTLSIPITDSNSQINEFYLNPVYEDAKGNLYTVAGSGVFSDATYEGEATSQSISYSKQKNKQKKETVEVTIKIVNVYAPNKIIILGMNERNEIIEIKQYKPNALPDKIETNASYLIVKSEKTNLDKQVIASGDIYSRDKNEIQTLKCNEKICTQTTTPIDWK